MEVSMAGLPFETSWLMDANGFRIALTIVSVDGSTGQVQGYMIDGNGNLTLEDAVWEDAARRFTFSRTLPSGERQTFTGFLFDSSGFQPNDVVPSGFAMAGTVTATMEDPDRPAFGWFALGDLVIG
jgi:hypothetical protein